MKTVVSFHNMMTTKNQLKFLQEILQVMVPRVALMEMYQDDENQINDLGEHGMTNLSRW